MGAGRFETGPYVLCILYRCHEDRWLSSRFTARRGWLWAIPAERDLWILDYGAIPASYLIRGAEWGVWDASVIRLPANFVR